eukprot:7971574-Ditylum_brightwellii.AAC.1
MKLLLQDVFTSLSSQQVQIPSTTSTASTTLKESDKRMMVVDPITAYPDVYGDLRLLRFLRKDKNQDPILAAQHFK